MNVLILTASFRTKGNTSRILDRLTDRLTGLCAQQGMDIHIQQINLADINLTYCHGCRVCFDRGETHCPFWNEIGPVKTALQPADVWIFSSPVYVDDVSGIMKSFLDRMAHVNHRPEFAGKYAFLLTTSGAGSSGHAARTLANTLRTWGVYIIGQKDFVAGALSTPDELNKRFNKNIDRIAAKIVEAFRNENALTPSIVSLIFFKVQQALWQRNKEDSIDYHYWESKGWLKPGVTWYIPHKANPLTVLLGRLTGSVIARFFE